MSGLRVALVAGPDPGHAFPIGALGSALRDRGHHVVVATGARWHDDLARDGLVPVDLPLLTPEPGDDDIGARIWRRAGQMAPPLATVLEEHRPDVVVTDVLTRAGAFAADLLGVPWLELSPHFLYDPDPWVPPVGMGARPSRNPLVRLDHASIRRRQRASFAAGRELARRSRAAIGLAGDEVPLGRLVATLPQLELPRRRWPSDAWVVGALAWEPPSWPELRPPAGDAPLVLVSDSTASEVDRSVAAVAVEALHGTHRLVVTTDREVPSQPGVVAGRGRHTPLLAQVDLVVAPAGHGLVVKALSNGVPLVVVPLQGDQFETATRLEVAGLGRRLDWDRLASVTLRSAAAAVLGDAGYQVRAAAAARTARRLGAGRAARLVEDLVEAAALRPGRPAGRA